MSSGSGQEKAARIQADAQREATAKYIEAMEKNQAILDQYRKENLLLLQQQEDQRRAVAESKQAGWQQYVDIAKQQLQANNEAANDPNSWYNKQITPEEFENSRQFQWELEQNQRAVNNSLVGKSGLLSGNAAKEILSANQGVVGREFNNYANLQMAQRQNRWNAQQSMLQAGMQGQQQYDANAYLSDYGTNAINLNQNYANQMMGINESIGSSQANSLINIGDINAAAAANKQSSLGGAFSGALSGAMAGGSVGGPWGALGGAVIGGVGGAVTAKNGGNASTQQSMGSGLGSIFGNLYKSQNGNNVQGWAMAS